MNHPGTWTTAVTEIQPNHVAVRGYDIAELMGNISFGQAVYLILRGELPDPSVGLLMEAILVASIDHGATPPSTLAARTVASTGANLGQSVAAGILSINRWHGGAIQDCAIQLGRIIQRAGKEQCKLQDAANAELADMKARGERMSGFGHRVHASDPRTRRLFELCREAGVAGPYLDAASAVEKFFEMTGKSLPINVDGAIGAVLAQLGFDPAVMNGVFMIARLPGLVAHVAEEQSREKPMRKIDPVHHAYDGPKSRTLK
ncbi:MAG: citryl-CoA lyase [Pirellulales bacterium]|nr:citryl-CoA lyase [Pirellulales bacterium]